LDTLIVPGVRTLADVPESIRATCAWIGECLSGSPAANDAALMVSRLAATAILYSTSGQPGDPITVSTAIGRGVARVHVISHGARCQHGRARSISIAAAAVAATPVGAGLTIVRELADVFTVEGRDKCFTLRIAGPVRPSPADGSGESEPEAER
jgi:anti-sigma regulatory factor (Ser/Thr protein kinase)